MDGQLLRRRDQTITGVAVGNNATMCPDLGLRPDLHTSVYSYILDLSHFLSTPLRDESNPVSQDLSLDRKPLPMQLLPVCINICSCCLKFLGLTTGLARPVGYCILSKPVLRNEAMHTPCSTPLLVYRFYSSSTRFNLFRINCVADVRYLRRAERPNSSVAEHSDSLQTICYQHLFLADK